MKLTQTGWDIAHIAINGPSDKTGEPILFMNFRQDYIQYPYDIGRFLEHIWERAHDCDENLSNEEIQAMLDALADWVTLTERSAPVALIYNE